MDIKEFVERMNNGLSLTKKEREKIILDSLCRDIRDYKCVIVMEELAELQQQISKKIRYDNRNNTELLEEMADVYIGLEYLKRIFDLDEVSIKKAIDVKLSREKERCEFIDRS